MMMLRLQSLAFQRSNARRSLRTTSISSNLHSLSSSLFSSNADNRACGRPQRRSSSALASCALTSTQSSHHHCTTTATRTFSSVFVSKHNHSLNVTAQDILDYSQSHGIETHQARTTNSHVILRECCFCEKPTQNKADNFYKLYIKIGGGAYFCHRCGASGSWFDYKIHLSGNNNNHASGGGNMVGVQRVSTGSNGGGSSNGIGSSGGNSSKTRKGAAAASRDGRSLERNTEQRIIPPLPMPPRRLQALYSNNLFAANADDSSSSSSSSNSVLNYLTTTRGLLPTTLRKYGVGKAQYSFANDQGAYEKQVCVTFGWIMSLKDAQFQEKLRGSVLNVDEYTASGSGATSNLESEDTGDQSSLEETFVTRRIKARSLQTKANQRLDPPGGAWGFFGYHTIPGDAKSIVLTEGEYDAMAVWQATGRPAISLPNGCRSLPVETLPMLEDFDKIYLWMDNDGPGQEGAELFTKKLGLERCYIVRPTMQNVGMDSAAADSAISATGNIKLPKDANEALLMGCNLESIIEDAKLTPHEQILTFDELRLDVLHEIMYPDKYVGTPMTSLPMVTSKIKGLRRGELTVLTGPTGSGKTTFLGQMSVDLAEQDVNVLWGSFEIKNTRLIHKLMQQYTREPLPSGVAAMSGKLEAIADRFARLPLYFLKFHGGSDVDDVLDAMDYAVYVNDCQHVILDNMQFMISRKATTSSWDKFDVQDQAIEKFRKFATDRNVHLTLVCHPRKEAEDTRLNISSFYGSAKATQEADTVLILQNERGKKSLEVKKNRFNGDLGHVPLYFERESGRYTEEQPYNTGGSGVGAGGNSFRLTPSATSNGSNYDGSIVVQNSPYPPGHKKLMPKIVVPLG